MQISSRFTIAMHILTYIATAPAEEKVTSEILADSVQVNPASRAASLIVTDIFLLLKISQILFCSIAVSRQSQY